MWFAPASKKRKRPAQRHSEPKVPTIRQGYDADDVSQYFGSFKRIRIQGAGRPVHKQYTPPLKSKQRKAGVRRGMGDIFWDDELFFVCHGGHLEGVQNEEKRRASPTSQASEIEN